MVLQIDIEKPGQRNARCQAGMVCSRLHVVVYCLTNGGLGSNGGPGEESWQLHKGGVMHEGDADIVWACGTRVYGPVDGVSALSLS